MNYIRILKIPYFQEVFMRNTLSLGKALRNESALINLDNKNESGTHWTCYKKIADRVWYFDSMGNIRPPKQLFDYLKLDEILYNQQRYQNFNSFICGHLCLKFLYNEL